MSYSYKTKVNNCVQEFVRDQGNTYYNIYDKDNNFMLRADYIGVEEQGYFWVQQGEKYGYYDSVKNIFHDLKLDYADNIRYGFGLVKNKIGQNGIIPIYEYQYFDAEKATLGAIFLEADQANPYTRVAQTKDGKWWVFQKGKGVPVAMCKTRAEACAIASNIEKEMIKLYGE